MIDVNVTPITQQIDVNISTDDISCDVVVDVNTVTIDVDVDPGIAVNKGDKGDDGDSAYQVAVDNGFVGTEQEWLDSLQGADGQDGQDGESAYQIWLDEGNTGTEQDFLDSLKGDKGDKGDTGDDGQDGANGLGFTGGSYNSSNGIVTFTSDDGLGFSTSDLRGANGTNGTNGSDGSDGSDGLGFTGGSYNGVSGVVTFTSDDGLGFATGDLRGADGQDGTDGTNGTNGTDGLGFTGGSYNTGNGIVTFTSDDGLGFSTGDLRGADGQDGTDGTNGQGVPVGGSAGQVLEKIDGTDYNTQWVTPSNGGTSIDFFQVQDSSGAGQTPPTSYTDVNSSIWGTAFTGTGFSWDGTELTVNSDSDAIEFNVSIQGITTLNNRVELGVRLMEDTGGGYTTLTTVTQYALRNNTQDEGNVTLVSFYTFNVASGTKYKIQIKRAGVSCSIGTQGGTYFNAKRFS